MGLLNLLFGRSPSRTDLASLNRDLEIANDCAKLIENTVNPEVFFSRYDLYMDKLSALADAEKTRSVKVSGESLYKKYKKMDTENSRVEVINEFINRMYTDTYSKASKLKTDSGRQKRQTAFYDVLQTYEDRMPIQCIQYYKSLDFSAITPTPDRKSISPSQIDEMQRTEATIGYQRMIYKRYYSGYSEKPYISQDRELNTNWTDQADMFPDQCVIPKSMMRRFSDGLLPGHIYMLYWLGKYTNKRVPVYFEYKYGVDFTKEKGFLKDNGYLNEADKPTPKGEKAINDHAKVIQNHMRKSPDSREQTLKQKQAFIKQGFENYTFVANSDCCDICQNLNGKHFPVSELKMGINAPPMHDGCRCSVAAYMDGKEYEDWLSHFS